MPEKQNELNQLETGYELPQSTFKLDTDTINSYLKAVDDNSFPYQEMNIIPPMAIAAITMGILSEEINLPSGTVHVSQEFVFSDIANFNDTLTVGAKIIRNLSRGKFHMLDIALTIQSQDNRTVLTGKTSFILPVQDNDNKG